MASLWSCHAPGPQPAGALTGYGGIPDCTLCLLDFWSILGHELEEEFKGQRLLRLTRYQGCHELERPLDWVVSKTIQHGNK